jgi:hypothetical protein
VGVASFGADPPVAGWAIACGTGNPSGSRDRRRGSGGVSTDQGCNPGRCSPISLRKSSKGSSRFRRRGRRWRMRCWFPPAHSHECSGAEEPQSRAIDWAGRKCLRRPLLLLSSQAAAHRRGDGPSRRKVAPRPRSATTINSRLAIAEFRQPGSSGDLLPPSPPAE